MPQFVGDATIGSVACVRENIAAHVAILGYPEEDVFLFIITLVVDGKNFEFHDFRLVLGNVSDRLIGSVYGTVNQKNPHCILVCHKEPKPAELDMPTAVGNRIKHLRIEQGLTLPALADKASLSKGLLYQIETSDDANPTLDTLNKIAKGLGVTSALLLDKPPVKARRIVPESLESGLEDYIREAREQGESLNEDTLQALYVLQHRSGAGAKTKEDWAWLYRSIEFSFGQRAKRNASGG